MWAAAAPVSGGLCGAVLSCLLFVCVWCECVSVCVCVWQLLLLGDCLAYCRSHAACSCVCWPHRAAHFACWGAARTRWEREWSSVVHCVCCSQPVLGGYPEPACCMQLASGPSSGTHSAVQTEHQERTRWRQSGQLGTHWRQQARQWRSASGIWRTVNGRVRRGSRQ